MSCSKGTYVRSLVRDLGDRLGCGAVTSSIRRVSSGAFHVDRAIGEKAFAQANSPSDFTFLHASDIFPHFNVLELTQELWDKKIQFGNALSEKDVSLCRWFRQTPEPHVILRLNDTHEVALGCLNLDKSLCVKKLL